MLKGNVKSLIYDLLKLIDNGGFESCEIIEQEIKERKVISFLLDKYPMSCFSKTDVNEVSNLLKERIGCSETIYKNGLIYLIEILLDL